MDNEFEIPELELPTLYGQLNLLCRLLVSAGQGDSRIFKAEVVEYYLSIVRVQSAPDLEASLKQYPSYMAEMRASLSVCECGNVTSFGGGYIVASCIQCQTHNPRRWYYMAERIAFQSGGKVHRRWAEITLARAIAARKGVRKQ